MSHPEAAPVLAKLLFAVLYSDESECQKARELLEEAYGSIDSRSAPYPFADTDYYAAEMGKELKRVFFAAAKLFPPENLPLVKHNCAEIEKKLSVNGQRAVNIDPGYLDLGKYVLASYKPAPTKLYLGTGVYADVTLLFRNRTFSPLPWSFPDFRSGIYNEYLLKLRYEYRRQRREYL